MSLDVRLKGATEVVPCTCPLCGDSHTCKESETLYEANITHNLGAMAREAGIYFHLWRPGEIGINTASQLIAPLEAGLSLLVSDPERFKKFNSPNGWGMYEHFVPFVSKYLEACKEYPQAEVHAYR